MKLEERRGFNDRKAKRFGKKTFIKKLFTYEHFSTWVKLNPEFKEKIKYKDYLKICKIIINEYSDQIVNNNLGVRLPYYMGSICVKYIDEITKTIIDQKTSDYVNKNIPFLNWNSSGKVAKIIWSTSNDQRFNRMLKYFSFEPCRKMKSKVFQKLKEYPEIFKTNRN